jgi:hypothetical protein
MISTSNMVLLPNPQQILIAGPIVRLSPDLVSATGEESIRKVYGGAEPWERDPFFQRVEGGEFIEGNIASLPTKEGLRVRRIMSGPFGRKYLLDQQSIFKDCVNNNLDEMVEMAKDDGVVDFYYLSRLYAFEVVSTRCPLQEVTLDLVAVGGCYKAEGEKLTIPECDIANRTPFSMVFPSRDVTKK